MVIPNYTQISNAFIDKMNEYNGAEVKVFMAISRKTIGWHKLSDCLSYKQLQDITGLAVNSMKKAIKKLVDDGWIVQRKTKYGYVYDLNIEVSEGVSKIDTTISKNDIAVSKNDIEGYQKLILQKKYKETNNKEINNKKNISVKSQSGDKEDNGLSNNSGNKEVEDKKNDSDLNVELRKDDIDNKAEIVLKYLNKRANRGFRKVSRHIRARLKEYELLDLLDVIDWKVEEWGEDEKMKKYLRPETLFSMEHFDTYLDEARQNLIKYSYEEYYQKKILHKQIMRAKRKGWELPRALTIQEWGEKHYEQWRQKRLEDIL